MTKFCGEIGFAITEKTSDGIYEETITSKVYYGDLEREGRRWEKSESINDDLIINNYVSIVADSFAMENVGNMRWVSVGGSKWTIRSVEIAYPRIKLTLGGVWNEE